jgi:hypothetical protein
MMLRIDIHRWFAMVLHLCVKLSVFAVSMATAGISKFPSLKAIYAHAIQHFY